MSGEDAPCLAVLGIALPHHDKPTVGPGGYRGTRLAKESETVDLELGSGPHRLGNAGCTWRDEADSEKDRQD